MCWGGGGGDGEESRGSELSIDWKGVSMGSEAVVDVDGVSVRVTLMSIGVSGVIWILAVAVGVSCELVVGWGRGCEVGGGQILYCSTAGDVTRAVVRGQAGLVVVTMVDTTVEFEPEGRQRRLAAWASSAEETSGFATGMAWKQRYSVGNPR